MYYQQNKAQDKDVYYQIEVTKPISAIRYKGAASQKMTMDILDVQGNIVLASVGPFNKGNVYQEHTVKVPERAGLRFILRFHNEVSTWFYIERITLVGKP